SEPDARREVIPVRLCLIGKTIRAVESHWIDVEQAGPRGRSNGIDRRAEVFITQSGCYSQRAGDAPPILEEVRMTEERRVIRRVAKGLAGSAAGAAEIVHEITEPREAVTGAVIENTAQGDRRELF